METRSALSSTTLSNRMRTDSNRMLGDLALKSITSARIDFSICIKTEMLDESTAAYRVAGRKVDRQVHEMRLRLRRGSAQGCLRRDILRPDRIDDRLEDWQRHPRPGLGRAKRTPLAVAIVVTDPHRDGHVVSKADEPAVDRVLGGAGLAADIGRERTDRAGGAAGDDPCSMVLSW